MTSAVELLRQGRTAEIWQKYCGFVELTREEYKLIQGRLLLEQVELLKACELGRRLLNGSKVSTVEEFRRAVPLTTYHDYVRWLGEKREDVLPAKPVTWVRTSGRTGEFPCKWAPVTKPGYDNLGKYFLGTQLLSSARRRGDVNIEEGDVYLYTAAPPPFPSGTILRAGRDEFPFRFVPTIEEAETMEFGERTQKAFRMAIDTGVDYFMGSGPVLVAIGETFAKGSGTGFSRDMLAPGALARSVKAVVTSKMRGEPLQPRHFWHPKGITVGGMDVQIYRKRIEALWGVRVFEGYGCSEFGNVAVQSWGARSAGMVPSSDCAFWEFLPEAEYNKWRADRTYQPESLLLTDLQPGGRYVIVGTSLLGGPFVRYVLGDMVSVLNTSDPELGVHLPQIVVESRADDLIDLGSMVWITERSLWQAFGYLELETTNWVARKEVTREAQTVVHIYVEDNGGRNGRLTGDFHEALIETMPDYKTYYDMTGKSHVQVTPLAPGTFQGYLDVRQAEGAELAYWKPPRMQPSEKVMKQLLTIHEENGGTRIEL